jgi:hypothetical protein
MDRDLILSYLKAAEEHVANGERRIAKHCDLVSTLERAGHDTTSTIALLREMEKMQVQHRADRDRLRAELAGLDAVEATKADASTRDPRLRLRRRIRRTPMGAGECTTHKVCLVVLYRPHGR